MEQGTSAASGAASTDQAKLCECGCGRPAPIATHTNAKLGYAKGHPTRFIRGHSTGKVPRRARRSLPRIMQLVKLCECGCGEPTPIARQSEQKRGYVKGQPVRFAPGHTGTLRSLRKAAEVPPEAPPEVRLCECGCGQPTPMARETNRKLGHVKGRPLRFIWGHGNRKIPHPGNRRLFVKAGQRIGLSVVLEPEMSHETATQTVRAVRLRCDCGTEYVRRLSNVLRNGVTESCGSCPRVDNLTGRRFGKLTVVRWVPSGATGRGRGGKWLCQCDCGNEVLLFPSFLTRGLNRGCGCGRFGPRPDNFRATFNRYRVGARERGLAWELTQNDFLRLTSLDCHYCGVAPGNVAGYFVFSGIDRLDNDRGYSVDNCVPCCKTCNFAKRDLPYDDWMAWIARLASFHFFRPDMTPVRLLKPPA